MSTRGNVAAAAVGCAVVVTSTILLWPTSNQPPAAPTSDQIKASAQARLDASLKAGHAARANIWAVGKTPNGKQCQAAWDNLLDSEQRDQRYAMWMLGCADTATP
ncbi:hypothetical protein ABZX90_31350 [Streptomyces sp. NPDC002935]|uniref:hypothetical protein n=1 Tax=Streptomyces sp. NPDC002935 TaxID=3154545 RepID=UPI0033B6A74C